MHNKLLCRTVFLQTVVPRAGIGTPGDSQPSVGRDGHEEMDIETRDQREEQKVLWGREEACATEGAFELGLGGKEGAGLGALTKETVIIKCCKC